MRLFLNFIIFVLIYGVAGAPPSIQEKRPAKTPHLGNLSTAELEYVRDHLRERGERFKHDYHLNREQAVLLKQELKEIEKETKNEKVNDKVGSILETNEKAGISEYLLEGDILVSKKEMDELDKEQAKKEAVAGRRKRQAINARVRPDKLWRGPIPYKFSPSLKPKAVAQIRRAIAFWEANTCLSFKENAKGPHVIEFIGGKGCYSPVGRQGPVQKVSIPAICPAEHEIGHALGFYHMHSRHDRDKYLAVNVAGMRPAVARSFRKMTENDNDNFGQPYDYGSVMQYGMRSFSNKGTGMAFAVYDKEYERTLGSLRVTFYDVMMMNRLYGCLSRCKNSKTVCYNGGYKDVRNCNVCKCPSGYGGKFCERRASGCGRTLTATSSYQTYSNTKDTPSLLEPLYPDYKGCYYWIKAPRGKHIEVKVHLLASKCSTGCKDVGAEFKIGADRRLTGYRYCCPGTKKIMTTVGDILPIISYTLSAQNVQFEITYRYRDGRRSKPSIQTLA